MNQTSNQKTGLARLHHAARVVKDQEANRRVLEDVLGIPLVATWCESVPHPEFPGTQFDLCHTFYRLDDGSALAFFQFADEADHDRYMPRLGTLTGRFDHIALKVDEAAYASLVSRVRTAGLSHYERDHGYCQSLYVPSDQGYMLEFTCDPDDVDRIDEAKAVTAHEDLRRWLAGDRSSNNTIRSG